MTPVTTLILTVFVASLLGSVHCAGMCGPFVALAVASGGARGVRLQVAYHGGRLVTYSLLGALAGWAGSGLDLGGAFFGLQRLALALAGAGMIVFGLFTLMGVAGVRMARLLPRGLRGATFGPTSVLRSAYARVHRHARSVAPSSRALVIGLASTLLPCGWLYAFALAAAGSGSAPVGALTLALFWLGTLPMMIALGAGLRRLSGPLRRHAPAIGAVALVIAGLVAIATRVEVPALVASPVVSIPEGEGPMTNAAQGVRAIDDAALPCCRRNE